MKATLGNTFHYAAEHWTSPTTLNPTDLTLADTDTKYDTFNTLDLTEIAAH